MPWPPDWPAAAREGCPDSIFAIARAAHDSPGRHYHTWEHIEECLAKARDFPCDSPRVVHLSLLFHDAIYVAGRKDNEERSAVLADATLSAHSQLPHEEVDEIRRIILATKRHVVDDAETGRDLRAVLDIDMSILGADPERYRRYAADVRHEWVPAVASARAYRAGRRRFLESVLAQPRIFSTGEGRARWEELARRNVASEIAAITAEQGAIERAIMALAKTFHRRH